MRHLIAHAISAPAERELGEVARAKHERLVAIGETE